MSDLCDEYELQPSVFNGWQRQALENLVASLERRGGARQAEAKAKAERQIRKLKARLAHKDEVIAEVAVRWWR